MLGSEMIICWDDQDTVQQFSYPLSTNINIIVKMS